jgi:thymidylate synthase ThyX
VHFFFAKKVLEEVHKDIPYIYGWVEATLARDLSSSCSELGIGFAPTGCLFFISFLWASFAWFSSFHC